LQQNKIDTKEVQLLGMPNAQAVLAFKGGSVDAIATYEPHVSQAASRPNSHRLVDSSTLPRLFSTVVFVSDNLAKQQPAALKQFLAALAEADNYWKANPEEAIKSVAPKWGIPEAEALSAASKTIPFSSDEQSKLLGDKATAGSVLPLLKTCHDLWRSTGLLTADVDLAKLLDASFLPPNLNAK
jgi:NitT/TauT family transport system substrate-binding protein